MVDVACARHRTDAPSAFHPPVVGVLGTIDGVRVVGGVARGIFVVWGVMACGRDGCRGGIVAEECKVCWVRVVFRGKPALRGAVACVVVMWHRKRPATPRAARRRPAGTHMARVAKAKAPCPRCGKGPCAVGGTYVNKCSGVLRHHRRSHATKARSGCPTYFTYPCTHTSSSTTGSCMPCMNTKPDSFGRPSHLVYRSGHLHQHH